MNLDELRAELNASEDCSVWRTGRKVGRTIYLQVSEEPSDDDTLIGMMDTPELAQHVVDAHNGLFDEVAGNGQ